MTSKHQYSPNFRAGMTNVKISSLGSGSRAGSSGYWKEGGSQKAMNVKGSPTGRVTHCIGTYTILLWSMATGTCDETCKWDELM